MENLTNLDASNVNPGRFKGQFDAQKWDDVTSEIRFLSVPWKSDYEHVVGWQSEQQRDAWFENEAELFFELTTGWNFKSLEVFKPGLGKHVGAIRVEVPYEIAINCNYLAVKMGEQPVPGDPAPEDRREHYYYFLTSLNKISPNTTELYLELDTWTTYINSVNIDLMKLERGHYTHALTPASAYLANPLDNHYGILDPEPGLPSHKPLISSENLVSFSKSSPRVCIATTADFTRAVDLWKDLTRTGRTYDGIPPENYWEQEMVEFGVVYWLGYEGYAPVPAVANQTVAGQIPGTQVYSMLPEDYASFINFLRARFPQVLKSIQSVFLLDSALIEEGAEIDFLGYSFKKVLQQNDPKLIQNLNLTKDLFDYDPEYADFAKLYTAQFAMIEISNLDGQRVEIAIEDVAESLEFYARSCSAFPFLKLEAFINGIGGKEKKTYAVKPWNTKNAELFQSDWAKYRFDIEIPTYGVFVENAEINGTDFQLEYYDILKDNGYGRRIDLLSMSRDYDNALASIGKNYDNDIDSIDLSYENESDSIANRLSEIANIFTNASLSIERNLDNASETRTRDLNVATYNINNTYNNATEEIALAYNTALKSAQNEQTNALETAATTLANAMLQRTTDNKNSSLSIATANEIAKANADTSWSIENYAINTVLTRKWTVARKIAQTSVKLNIMNIDRKAQIDVFTGALQSIGGLAAQPNPINALGSGISAVASGINMLLFLETEFETMADQANLQNALDNVNLYYPNANISYNGDSLGRLSYEAEKDERTFANTQTKINADEVADLQTLADSTNLALTYTNTGTMINATNVLQTRIANRNYGAAEYIMNQTKSTSEGIRDRNKTLSETIRDLNYNVLGIINLRNRNTDTEIAENTRDTGNSIMEVVEGINERTKEASEGIALRTKNADTSIAANSQTAANSISRNRWNNHFENIHTALMQNSIAAPQKISENSGNAWIDSWGQRGLEVKIRRCSKATEKLAGDTFKLYGYYSRNVMIENPNLTINGKFTYWKAEDLWLNGDKINETNKEILRTAFLKGVTIWDNPNTMMKGGF